VEAGLRTYRKYSPYPEEINRQLTGILADIHFAPTLKAADNLIKENKKKETIFITGNTAIDAIRSTIDPEYKNEVLNQIDKKRLILVTVHRRENLGEPMKQIFQAIRKIADTFKDTHILYPMHLNPVIQEAAKNILGDLPQITLTNPLDVIDFHNIGSRSHLILTDSDGIQEEGPSLGVPVIVLREKTERPEGLKAGTLKLAGTNEDQIVK
jgi:UDP-N-acetylglucosamine 2-epimerase (non-hydrolysing)